MSNARRLVEDALPRDMVRKVWTGNFDKALPLAVQKFEISAILPAVFYMFRFGHRRGKGKFLDTFGTRTGTATERKSSATIDRISEKLASSVGLEGFEKDVEKAILGDLLLCYCLENVRQSLGRDKQIQRVMPAHYMASWIDLPLSISDLRYAPEMIVAMLANQKGDNVTLSDEEHQTRFAVGKGYENNVLLRVFSQGITRHGQLLGNVISDRFDEEDSSVGLDQLLMVRLAQQLPQPPGKMRGQDGSVISNQRPIAKNAACHFSDDIRRFVRSYAVPTPRQVLVEMLESCVAIGMTTLLTSTVEMLFLWTATGKVPEDQDQQPAHLFVDCSNGIDHQIRLSSERAMDDFMRRVDRLPVILMALRLLDYKASNNKRIEGYRKQHNILFRPYATDWINLLGDLLHKHHREAERIYFSIEDDIDQLIARLREDSTESEEIMNEVDDQRNPVWRLADGLIALMGPHSRSNFMKMIDSVLSTDRPNGLAVKKTTTRGTGAGGNETRRKREVRSLVFTDSVLDYLVHLHLLKSGNKPGVRSLSFGRFIEILQERYGFHVATAPPGMTISNELLQRNRAILERRLRDLGLLVGVNDAEAMKRLQPRFESTMEG